MTMKKKLISSAIVAVMCGLYLPVASAQLPPPPGGTTTPLPGDTTTPPPGGTTTPPPDGTITPPPGGTITPPPGGTITPPPGGTITPPPGGTTLPPGGTTLPPLPTPPTDFTNIKPEDFFQQFKPTDFSGFTGANLDNMKPEFLQNFTPEHIANLAPDAIGALDKSQFQNLAPTAMTGFSADQLQKLDPTVMSGMMPTQLGALKPEAMAGFKPEQIGALAPEMMSKFTPEQFTKLDPKAFEGITPQQITALTGTQIGALDREKLGALSPEAIKAMSDDVLGSLNKTEFKSMDSDDFSKMMVNFDPTKFSPTELADFIPPSWNMNVQTGLLTAPPGAELQFKALPSLDTSTIQMPTLPDLNSKLAIGGTASGGNTVLQGMTQALANVDPNLKFEQIGGILNVKGTGASAGPLAAFIPDSSAMIQAPADAKPGITVDATGKFVLTTPEGYMVPVIPALQNPTDLINAVPGLTLDVADKGETMIKLPGSNPLNGIADPFVTTSTQPPGIYRSGEKGNEEALVVYPDGTAQKVKPTIQSPTEFQTTADEIPGVDDVKISVDGSIQLKLGGQPLTLKPEFEIAPGASGTVVTPSIRLINSTTAEFTNARGDKQLFYVKQ